MFQYTVKWSRMCVGGIERESQLRERIIILKHAHADGRRLSDEDLICKCDQWELRRMSPRSTNQSERDGDSSCGLGVYLWL